MKSEAYKPTKEVLTNAVNGLLGLHQESVKQPFQNHAIDGINVYPTPTREVQAWGYTMDGRKVRTTSTYYEVY